ncbi:MAG: ribosomal-processing cysteine protease Prp [Bacilli bacterium]|nr:ribosomal-processing cysteine protease Prp [Bacilli bacterium]
MIKVDLSKDKLITVSGHSGYEERGKDIVCASVSSIVITTINAIIEIDNDAIDYSDLDNKIIIRIIKEDEIVNKLIHNMILLLESLEKDYKDYIKIIRR